LITCREFARPVPHGICEHRRQVRSPIGVAVRVGPTFAYMASKSFFRNPNRFAGSRLPGLPPMWRMTGAAADPVRSGTRIALDGETRGGRPVRYRIATSISGPDLSVAAMSGAGTALHDSRDALAIRRVLSRSHATFRF